MPATREVIYARAPGAESSRLGSETILLDPDGQRVRALNATAGRIWELTDGARTVQQIADVLALEHGCPPARALEDVQHFLDALAARKLVTPVTGATP